MRLLSKAGWVFDRFIDAMLALAAFIVFVQTIWISQDVIIRKAFNWTWAPSFEIMIYSLVWMTFLGTAAIYRDRGHVVMEAIAGRFSAKVQDILAVVTSCAIAAVLAFLLFFSARLTIQDYLNDFTLASVLNPPKWPIEMVIPISFLLLFIQSIRHAVTYYRAYRSGEVIKAGEQTSL
jgi:TRAP-type C4-dicarboxylate transport system permease small subunit